MTAITQPMMSIGPKKNQAEASSYYGAVFVQELAFAAAATVIVLAAIPLLATVVREPLLHGLRIPIAAVVCTSSLQDFARRHFFTRSRPKLAAVIDFISYGGQVLVLLPLAFGARLTPATALVTIAATSLIAISFAAISRPGLLWPGYEYCLSIAKQHWRFSRWLAASAVLSWSSVYFFPLIAASILGPVAAGVLRIAASTVGLLNVLFLGLENAVPRNAAQLLSSTGLHAMRSYLMRIAAFATGCTFCIVIAVFAAPGLWMKLMYGSQYEAYGVVLELYALVYLVRSLDIPLSAAFRAMEYVKPIFLGYVAGTLYALAVAPMAARHFGLAGVAAAMIGCQFLLVLVQFLQLPAGARHVSARLTACSA